MRILHTPTKIKNIICKCSSISFSTSYEHRSEAGMFSLSVPLTRRPATMTETSSDRVVYYFYD